MPHLPKAQLLVGLFLTCLPGICWAQQVKISPSDLMKKDDAYFQSSEGMQFLENVLSFQNSDGGFPKNYVLNQPRPTTRPQGRLPIDQFGEWNSTSTIDNSATFTEIRLLARGFRMTKNAAFRDAAIKGIDFLIANQYPNGGWAQRFPVPEKGYHKHITYNDNAMTGVMILMKDVAAGKTDFDFADPKLRSKAETSFLKGIDCILKTQIRVNGKLTAWCQQHDYQTLSPVEARKFEPACICSSESVSIIRLLMSIEKPSREVKESISAAVQWLDDVKITGKKLERFTAENGKPDMRLIDDPAAGPIWSRMYEIGTNKPIFGSVDGKIYYDWMQITQERRTGYAWYRPFAANLFQQHEQWLKKNRSVD